MQRIITVILIFLLNNLAAAQAKESNILIVAENALNAMQSSLVSFAQVDSSGNKMEGILLIDRTKKFLRIEYAEPSPLQIIVRAKKIYIYDYDLDQYNYADNEQNFFSVFFSGTLTKLDEKPRVSKTAKVFKLDLFVKEFQQHITINFSRDTQPKLLSMQITEESGNIIEIYINKIQPLKNISEELFIMKNPKIFGPPKPIDISKFELTDK
ncbi:MAG: outer-membrane lipoprotein carrier protein LolA [Rickettsiaceae bacterium]|nr:outer-membrane lipoprotein carrier protein LolA [Rickettsiaceae bacterium]